jgi:hypothetical protein
MTTREDCRLMAIGLLYSGLDVEKLSPKAKAELRAALDALLRLLDAAA